MSMHIVVSSVCQSSSLHPCKCLYLCTCPWYMCCCLLGVYWVASSSSLWYRPRGILEPTPTCHTGCKLGLEVSMWLSEKSKRVGHAAEGWVSNTSGTIALSSIGWQVQSDSGSNWSFFVLSNHAWFQKDFHDTFSYIYIVLALTTTQVLNSKVN